MKQPLGAALAAASLIALTLFTYWYVKGRQLDRLHGVLASRAELYAATIGGALDKYEFLPLAIAQSDEVANLLEQASPERVARANAYLHDINHRAGTFAVYVLDLAGTTLASSNWQDRNSYVGQNYGFRPYFTQAAAGGIGRFYGIGASTFEAGYFISQPIRRHGRIIGVAATKVNLDWIEHSWRIPGVAEQIWVKDANGVIILSTNPAFKFKILAALSEAAKTSIRAQRQFLQESLPILPHQVLQQFADGAAHLALERPRDAGIAGLGGSAEYLAVGRHLAPLEWQITVLAELDQVRAAARNTAAAVGLGWALLLLGALYARQRRRRIDERLNAQQALKGAYEELELKVAQRTGDLLDANRRLQAEVGERERAEQTLRYAQAELVQSGKLAAIGQMAAGVTHELNQPLAALLTFSANAKVFIARGQTEDALDNLSTISDLVTRLGYITSQLKAFARRADDARKPANVRQAFAQTMLQIRTRNGSARLLLDESWPRHELVVLCNAIGLEQVFSNLISNAMDAVPPAQEARIGVDVRAEDGLAVIRISDNGPGIPEAHIERIFDPFYTTKEHGLGLGLSISAGIIRAAGGALSVRNRAAADGGGAQFTITLSCHDADKGTPDA
ncbi:sensor histidine kinase [Janthinobacterium fluminis]|uniref:histidine kinase n=1 Tax=Janthinobacterium fluminis TaxID=2987524 RepID=A0ABT5K4Z2_9BURK|nr:ATP-binding protein [Janthinobacterium fluminis]MDC8760072.1 ATP-binding protein [Janthinobacterium fluminis]